MRHARALAALLLLTTLTMPVRADPGGTDAPDEWPHATPLAPGTYAGTLGPWEDDAYDWYALAHGPGEGVRVTAFLPRYFQVRYVAGDETPPQWPPRYVEAIPFNQTHWIAQFTVGGDGIVHLQFALGGPFVAHAEGYEFSFERVPIADLRVQELRVTELPLCEACGGVASFRVHVRLANAGLLPYSGSVRIDATGNGGLMYDDIASVHVSLPPGTEVEMGYNWYAVAAGNLTFTARAAVPDHAPWNDRIQTTHVVLADVPGVVVYRPF